ncbi:type IV pilus modification protein PilV [Halomonas halocynthiae]|uniref:type IV pilus modification protein PilV n=1 Tax=Halomonas halocynthiae TaxID=176290 RepID=UPI00040B8560|nr:type IV pilus modification protein PilV [Halomonas halocynthiae]
MSTRRGQVGTGLIEVLVAVVLLATALLGFTRLHIETQKDQRLSYGYSMAQALALNLSERIHANSKGLSSYTVSGIASTPVVNGCGSGCSSTLLAAQDLADWKRAVLRSALPLGDADVDVSAGQVTITVTWQDSFSDALLRQSFSFEVRRL